MKRRSTQRRGVRGEEKKRRAQEQPPQTIPIFINGVATRTRHQDKLNSPKLTDQPRPILVNILSYFDQETLRDVVCLLSKLFQDIIDNDPGMENKVIPLLLISPSKKTRPSTKRLDRLIKQLYRHRIKLQRYRAIKIIDGHKFSMSYNYSIPEKLRLDEVISIDMSSFTCSPGTFGFFDDLLLFLSKVSPNLREINLSNIMTRNYKDVMKQLSTQCSHLEKITWTNTNKYTESFISIDGRHMSSAKNLKEIYMDYNVFNGGAPLVKLSDLDNDDYSKVFLFHKCSNEGLERVSIKNARYSKIGCCTRIKIPQTALIKFIRNSPSSLRWFRSNLSRKNRTMMRSERPEIEFV